MRDIDIRRELIREVKQLHAAEVDTLYVEELGVCQGSARVDLAVVNGRLHGYEIKSARDTLARLPQQRDLYGAVLEFVTIVAAESHLSEVRKIVPPWWGIWTARSEGSKTILEGEREASRNTTVEAHALAQLLWHNEVQDVLLGLGQSKVRGKTRKELWGRLAAHVSADELAGIVRAKLKLRGSDWRANL